MIKSFLQSSERHIHNAYRKWIRPHFRELNLQRLKLLWFGWGYLPLISLHSLRFLSRIKILIEFIRIDWHVVHAHKPCEIVRVCEAIAERRAFPGEIVVEAGCWKGGSTAKLSILCDLFGYELWIYNSFQGVEAVYEGGYNFTGEYAAAQDEVRNNIQHFGCLQVCTITSGWFKDTLALAPITRPIRLAYIDCDLAKGTNEVLEGIIPGLVQDGVIFTQDYHIRSVRNLLQDHHTWCSLRKPMPEITELCAHLASLQFN